MNFDQAMMLLNALGSWVAGAGSLAAVGVALWLARRVEKVKLDAWVGHRVLVRAGTKAECLGINVTNLGERPVTISSIGWIIGHGKGRRVCFQQIPQSSPTNYPKRIEYGEEAMFLVDDFSTWASYFKSGFLEEFNDRDLKTLRLQVHTSVGHIENVVPENGLLDRLQNN